MQGLVTDSASRLVYSVSLVWVGKTLILGLGTLFKHLILISVASFIAPTIQSKTLVSSMKVWAIIMCS